MEQVKTISNETLKKVLHDVCVCEGYVDEFMEKTSAKALKEELKSFLFRLQTARKSLNAYLIVKRGDDQKASQSSYFQDWMNEFKKCLMDSSQDYMKELKKMLQQYQKQVSSILHGASIYDPQLHRILHILYDDYAAAIYCFDRYLVTMNK